MGDIAKVLITCGIVLMASGIVLLVLGKIPGIGKLPGDLIIKKDNFTLYFPIVTCLILSLILSFLFFLWNQK